MSDSDFQTCDLCGNPIEGLSLEVNMESDEGYITHLEICENCLDDMNDDHSDYDIPSPREPGVFYHDEPDEDYG